MSSAPASADLPIEAGDAPAEKSAAPPEESLELLRRQLLFRAARRAFPEMERILVRVLTTDQVALMERDECMKWLKLLDISDLDLLEWLQGTGEISQEIDRNHLQALARAAKEG